MSKAELEELLADYRARIASLEEELLETKNHLEILKRHIVGSMSYEEMR